MKNYVEELLGLAESYSFQFREDKNVLAITVVGSAAYGLCDAASDLDLMIQYRSISDEKYALLRAEGEKHKPLYIIGGPEYDFITIGRFVETGAKVDFAHIVADKFQQSINAVIKNNDPSPDHQAVLFGINNSLVLYDTGLISSWRRQIATYPNGLKTATLKQSLHFTPRSVYFEMGVNRKDELFVKEAILQDLGKVLQTLFCLNEVYNPGKLKGLGWIIDKQLPLKPDNFSKRMHATLNSPAQQAATEMLSLINDTISLVEQQLPNYDCSAARKRMDLVLRRVYTNPHSKCGHGSSGYA